MQSQVEASSLSGAQLGIWLGHQRADDGTVFHAAEYVLLEGELDTEAFGRALDATFAEATALHAVYGERDGRPVRLPATHRGVALEQVTLLGDEAALLEHARRVLRQPMDLERGPLHRHQLITLGRTRHAWLHVAHHIALDGYGFGLIARRVAEHYGALLDHCAPPVCSFTAFAQVLEEDRAYQGSRSRAEARAFWRDELGTSRAADLGVVAAPGHALRHRRTLGPERVLQLREECSRQGVNWLELMLSLVSVRIGLMTGRRSFVLGLPVMLRLGTRALRTPCMAMNIAPLPVSLTDTSLVMLSRRLRADLTRQRRHQSYRYEHLRMDRGFHAGRLFGPVVNVMPFDHPLRFGNCTARGLGVAAGPVEDLSIGIAPRGTELELVLDGHPQRFDEARLDRLARELESDVVAFLAQPHAVVALAPLSREEPRGWPLAALFAHASARPEAPALVAGQHMLSFAELARLTQASALWLVQQGVRSGDLVAIELARGASAVVMMLGTLHAGAGYVMLDPAHPLARRRAMLERARPRLTVVGPGSSLTFANDEALCVHTDARLDAWRKAEPTHVAATERCASDLAYVVFTSGSTGEPKAVAVSTHALSSFVASALARYGWKDTDRVLQFAPLTFDASVEELFVGLAAGATLVLRDEGSLDSPEAFLAFCREHAVSVLDLPTAFWHELALAVTQRSLSLPSCLRQILIGGEAASPVRVKAWTQQVTGVSLLNTYGPSEATVVSTVADLSQWSEDDVPIGTPLEGVGVVLYDAELRQVGDGELGELFLLGPTLAHGYLGREDLTRERFVELPGLGRAYRTGDLCVRRPDGQLSYRGRVDDELKISGHRISPAEVEFVLSSHPLVRAALAFGETAHDGSKRLVAHVEADPALLAPETLRRYAHTLLPAVMVPARLDVHARLPRTTHGKIDRSALSHEPAVDGDVNGEDLSPLEVIVLDAWRTVLGLADVGLDDDFFARGGHSLHVIQLANRLSSAGREMRVSAIFRHPTPRRQARLLAQADEAPGSAGFRPLPVAIPPDWFGVARPDAKAATRVLLTGASGFVGVHLLEAWLTLTERQVVCVVRGESDALARTRLFTAAHAFGIDLSRWASRIEVLALDLTTASRDSLSERLAPCATVFHCAAQVSVLRDYESLVPSNVLATRELLGLSGLWGAGFHFVSSVATLPSVVAPAESLHPAHEGLRDGYQRSKWHAEALCGAASECGLDVAVYRLGRVVAPRHRPVVHTSDLVWRIARAAVRAGAFPALTVEEPWIPADEAAQVMVRLSLGEAARHPAAAYHLVQTGTVRLEEFGAALVRAGHDLTMLPMATWLEHVRARGDDEDRATLAFFEREAGLTLDAGGPSEIPFARVKALLPNLNTRPMDSAWLDALCVKARADGLFEQANDARRKENGYESVR